MIEIRQWVKPDIVCVLPKQNVYGDETHDKYSIVIEKQIIVIQSCDSEGNLPHYNNANYYGLRVIKDKMDICLPKHGWIPVYEEIQDMYNEELAEQVLIGEQ